jgi:hypothetical protein
MHVYIQLLAVEHSWSISTGSFDHPCYSPDLTLSNYHLFTYLKSWLGSQRFNSNELNKSQNVAEFIGGKLV